jgi:hypothetical protein
MAMDPSYISALSGLAGAIIGGLTSFGTTWLTQTTQRRERLVAAERKTRENLYVDFIQEASRMFADALSHEQTEIAQLVKLYSISAHIRMVSSTRIVEASEAVIDAILEAYSRPNRTLAEIRDYAKAGGFNPLHNFAQLSREELAEFRHTSD